MPDIERIKNFLESSAGKELKQILINAVFELENIQNLKDLDDAENLALEVKASKKAAEKLRQILSQFMIYEMKGREKGNRDKFYVGV